MCVPKKKMQVVEFCFKMFQFVAELANLYSAVFILDSSVSVAPFHDEFVIYEQNMKGT